jgi:hypothetical protein
MTIAAAVMAACHCHLHFRLFMFTLNSSLAQVLNFMAFHLDSGRIKMFFFHPTPTPRVVSGASF